MTALIIALAAASVGMAVVLVIALRRGSSTGGGEASNVDELRRTQFELRQARQLSALAETLDLDQLLARLLQGAALLTEADAAAVAIWNEDEPPIVKTMNLTADEALPLLGSWPPESRSRSLTVRYHFPGESVPANAVQIGVLLPLPTEQAGGGGALGVFWRRHLQRNIEDHLPVLEELALTAARAIENARQFQEIHELAVRDALTGLYNRRYFHETLAQEVKRAHRYDRRLALIFFDLDDFKMVNEEIGHLGGDAVLAEVAQRLRSVVRGADIACRVGGDEFAVILPESSLEDSQTFFRRMELAIQAQAVGRVTHLQLSAGMAELGRDDDATSLFRRADQALFRAKRSGKGRALPAGESDLSGERPESDLPSELP